MQRVKIKNEQVSTKYVPWAKIGPICFYTQTCLTGHSHTPGCPFCVLVLGYSGLAGIVAMEIMEAAKPMYHLALYRKSS